MTLAFCQGITGQGGGGEGHPEDDEVDPEDDEVEDEGEEGEEW